MPFTPSPGTVLVLEKDGSGGGKVIERLQTDSDGHFEVRLPPGDYILLAPSRQADVGEFHTYPSEVRVRAHDFARVEVRTWAELP